VAYPKYTGNGFSHYKSHFQKPKPKVVLDPNFIPSSYQKDIFDWVVNGDGNAIIMAVAGSGKSKSIVEALNYIPSSKSVMFLAFNKSIATALQERVPAHVQAKTLNSLGYSAWRNHMKGVNVKVEPYKTTNIIDKMCDFYKDKYTETLKEEFSTKADLLEDEKWTIKEMVAKAKISGMVPKGSDLEGLVEDCESVWDWIVSQYSIEPSTDDINIRILYSLASEVLQESVATTGVIDFDDQFYMPLLYNSKFQTYDWVLVDESQDVSDIQREILKRVYSPGVTRMVLVGDPKQAIYGFRGANPESMDLLKKEFSCLEFPLSICYRCSSEVVKFAQSLVPVLEVSPTAQKGSVNYLGDLGKDWDLKTFKQEDMIICRNTAPLVNLCYKLLKAGIPATVKGRDIGKGLVALIDKMRVLKIETLYTKLDAWKVAETKRFLSKNPNANTSFIDDKVESILAISELIEDGKVSTLKAEIISMFKMDVPEVDGKQNILTLSTIHKAKGLEATNVYVLQPSLMPSKYAKHDWEHSQEQNIMYVAYTRAKLNLNFITLPQKKKES
jgi:DNA helicase-2/ATP-dependent DNA helicase PcrA